MPRTRARPVVSLEHCLECGAVVSARFCGTCGALVAGAQEDGAVTPLAPSRPTRRRELSRRSRWLVALVGLLAVGALAVLTRGPDLRETVTVPGDLSNGGVTSDVAPGDLSVEHWRLDVLGDAERWPLWVGALTETEVVVHDPRWGPRAFDRLTGERSARPVWPPEQHVIEAGLVLAIDTDGAPRVLAELSSEDAPDSPDTRFLTAAGDLWLSWHEGEVTAYDRDFDVAWRTRHPGVGWIRAARVRDGAILVDGNDRVVSLDARTGAVRWEARAITYGALWTDDLLLVTGDSTDIAADRAVGALAAIDLDDGSVAWAVDGTSGTWHATDGEHALATYWHLTGGIGTLVVDLSDGRIVSDSEGGYRSSTPIDVDTQPEHGIGALLERRGEDGGTVLVGPDGTEIWTSHLQLLSEPPEDRRVVHDPATGGLALVVSTPDHVAVHALPDGEVVFERTLRVAPPDRGRPLAVTRGVAATTLVASAGRDRPALVDLVTGDRLAQLPQVDTVVATPEGFLTVRAAIRKRLALFDPDGSLRWEADEVPSGVHGVEILATTPDTATLAWHAQTTHIVAQRLDDGGSLGSLRVDASSYASGVTPRGPALTSWSDDVETGPQAPELVVVASGEEPSVVWRAPSMGGQIATDGQHLVEVGRGTFRRLDPDTGEVLDTAPLALRPLGPVVAAAGRLVVHANSDLVAHELATGDVAWRRRFDAPITASPVVAGDQVLVGLEDGSVRRLAMDDGRDLGTVTIGADPILEVVAVHEVLLVRDARALVLRGPEELPERLLHASGTTRRRTPGGEVRVPAP